MFSCKKDIVKVEVAAGYPFYYEDDIYRWDKSCTYFPEVCDCHCEIKGDDGRWHDTDVDCKKFSVSPCDQVD